MPGICSVLTPSERRNLRMPAGRARAIITTMAALLVLTPAALSSKPLRTRPLARSQPPAPLGWFLLGTSGTYLAHFASLYPQLPGLFGDAGLQPVRFTIGVSDAWMLPHAAPQAGMEAFAALGILLSTAQLAIRPLQYGLGGMMAFSVQ